MDECPSCKVALVVVSINFRWNGADGIFACPACGLIVGAEVIHARRCDMKKPAKTAAELEAMIRVEMESACEWPMGIELHVEPDADTWKVVVRSESQDKNAGMTEIVHLISDKLRIEFDLIG